MSNLTSKLRLMVIVALCISATGCINYKKSLYFKDLPETVPVQGEIYPEATYKDLTIKSDDMLQITVQTIDFQGGASIDGTPISTESSTIPGYLVDRLGNIDLPLVGTVNVLGMTIVEAKDMIRKRASVYYKDPIVNVQFTNFEVTLLGDVASPGKYRLNSQKVSILDAIAVAHDLTITAKRDRILLIRTVNGEKKIVKLDINSADIFNSPYYYLQQKDIIYVVPNKTKVAASQGLFARNISIITTLLSTVTIGLNTYLLIKANK